MALNSDVGVAPEQQEVIERAAREYWDAWFAGDADRIARCLHPALAKQYVADPDDPGAAVEQEGWQDMVDGAMRGDGTKYRGLAFEATLLSATANIAAVRLAGGPFVDLLHLGRFGDAWRIVNVLWEEPAKRP